VGESDSSIFLLLTVSLLLSKLIFSHFISVLLISSMPPRPAPVPVAAPTLPLDHPQSPHSAPLLTTPPQQAPLTSLPEISDFFGPAIFSRPSRSVDLGYGHRHGYGRDEAEWEALKEPEASSPSMTVSSFFTLLDGQEALQNAAQRL
jgi:hypothetical protein